MNLEELYCKLSIGVLKNLAMSNNGDGTIEESKKKGILLHANMALNRLYSRFLLSEKTLTIQLQEGRTYYHMLKPFSVSGHDPNVIDEPYIIDSLNEPFMQDVIRVLSVTDRWGCKTRLNDAGACSSVWSPKPETLQINEVEAGAPLIVNYQAKHPILCYFEGGEDNKDVEANYDLNNETANIVLLPEILHEALFAYIGYAVYNGINTAESKGIAAEHKATYEELCQIWIDRDLGSESVSQTSTKFAKGGWC